MNWKRAAAALLLWRGATAGARRRRARTGLPYRRRPAYRRRGMLNRLFGY